MRGKWSVQWRGLWLQVNFVSICQLPVIHCLVLLVMYWYKCYFNFLLSSDVFELLLLVKSYNEYCLRSVLFLGHWSQRGCVKNVQLSSFSETVCECNHLTHFAILLSPKPPAYSDPVKLSLNYISTIGVVISLLAMIITVFTFSALK